MKKRIQMAALAATLLLSGHASAENPFGFTFGMSKRAVEKAVAEMGMGIPKWFGGTLVVQGQDNRLHAYLFNFCEDKLYEVSQDFPANFDQMAGFVDASIREHGQPMFVSAQGATTPQGFLRPINLYWRLDESTYVRLMQLANKYSIIYQTTNACVKVPS